MNAFKFFPVFFSLLFLFANYSFSQNSRIKCYFNHPVNNSISSGVDAVYLNGTFPDTVAAYINRAKFTIDIALYNYTSGSTSLVARIATAANNAKSRGVTIRWIYDGSSTNSGLNLLDTAIKTLGSPTTTGYGIMHNKFMVIDANSVNDSDAIVMTGSYNWSTTQTSFDYNNIIVLQDKSLALAYYNEFNKMWGGTGALPNISVSTFGTFKTASTQALFNVNGSPVELYFSPKDGASTHIKNVINSADNEIFFGIYTFTDNSIATKLKTKYTSGVSVRGIIDQFSQTYSPYSTLSPVLDTNLILYTGTYLYHNKMLVVDAAHPASDPQVVTGSYNWSSSGTNTNDENMLVVHEASIANQYLQSLCQDFSGLGGAPCVTALPLNLTYFKATFQNHKPLLQWTTAAQTDAQYFVIETSYDGSRFGDLAKINAAANNAFQYQFQDESYGGGAIYYRLRIVDKDGRFVYSKVVSLTSYNEHELFVYPNPVSSQLFVQLNSSGKKTSILQIADAAGRIVRQQSIAADAGINSPSFNTSSLASGVYFLMVKGEERSAQKFIKR